LPKNIPPIQGAGTDRIAFAKAATLRCLKIVTIFLLILKKKQEAAFRLVTKGCSEAILVKKSHCSRRL